MIRITDTLSIDERDLTFDFVRASGPGGQHVNKVATAVQLRFDTALLPEGVRGRARRLAGRRLTNEGVLVIAAKRYRTQERNRQDAVDRLVGLLRRAAEPPRPRRKTKRTHASIERRLRAKKRRGELKRGRRREPPPD